MIKPKYIRAVLLVAFCSSLLSCHTSKRQTNISQEMNSFESLTLKIEKGLIEDQRIRKAYIEKLNSEGHDQALNIEMGRIDSANQVIALEFLETYGWPKKSEVGEKVSKGIFLIIQHAEHKEMKKYLPQLMAMVEINEASKIDGALMTDRVLMGDGKRQLYGTQAVPRRNKQGYITSDYYIWPIQDPKSVNELRKKIGFKTTIQESAKSLGASYDPDEALPITP